MNFRRFLGKQVGNMNAAMGTVLAIVGIAITFIVFPIIMDATHDVQTDADNQAFAAVVTGVGETTADVILTKDVWEGLVANVTSVTSDEVTDVPVAGTYTAATNTLHVTGLVASDSRTLTVAYISDALTAYTGMSAIVGVTPLLVWVSIIGLAIAGIWIGVKGRN